MEVLNSPNPLAGDFVVLLKRQQLISENPRLSVDRLPDRRFAIYLEAVSRSRRGRVLVCLKGSVFPVRLHLGALDLASIPL